MHVANMKKITTHYCISSHTCVVDVMQPAIRADRNVLSSCSVLNCGRRDATKSSWICPFEKGIYWKLVDYDEVVNMAAGDLHLRPSSEIGIPRCFWKFVI